jgi:aspartyl-tRNA synthetase
MYTVYPIGSPGSCSVGQKVALRGWVHRVRDHGGLLFVDIRDYDGVMQCALDASNPNIAALAKIREESCVEVRGTPRLRPEGTTNDRLGFVGKYELVVEEFEIFNQAAVLPFTLHEEDFTASDEARLRYRYLDLRRPKMQQNLKLRSDVIWMLRNEMVRQDFMEIQTPILTASSPEGARDYLVPARLHPGKFYALPQAPQIFKQILMCSGVQRYFQIAPCFRDEAGRSDRSPGEFYQLDMEMAFATQEEVFGVVKDVISRVFEEFTSISYCGPTSNWYVNPEWRTYTYDASIQLFGNDKPDLRVDDNIYIRDVTEVVAPNAPPFLQEVIDKNGVVLCIPVYADAGKLTGKWHKDMDNYAKDLGMPGLGYFKITDWKESLSHARTEPHVLTGVSGPMEKFFTDEQMWSIAVDFMDETTCAQFEKPDASYMFIAGPKKEAYQWASKLRVEAAKRSDNYDEESFQFCWIVDFPMFELNEETGKVEFSHNPFSMPQGGMDALLNQDPLTIKAHQYDLVCNGVELSSGAIRNHRIDVMEKAFEIAGYDPAVVQTKFPALYNAFRYGAPPHGGIAPGIDRMVMLLANEPNIREIVAFPMNNSAQDLMMGAPSEVTPEQLKELHIKVTAK